MTGSTFGTLFKISTFGESHGKGIGVVIDGCPAGLFFDTQFIQHQLSLRKPGQSNIVTQRHEEDSVEVLSGVFEQHTTGTPIALYIANTDPKSTDYEHIKTAFRPSHADYTYHYKYAGHRDYRGGGRSSARETAARVAAGAVAQLLLKHWYPNLYIYAYTSQVGHIVVPTPYTNLNLTLTYTNPVRCPHLPTATQMEALIKAVRKDGDTIGGVVTGVVQGVPAGLGEPVFDKLHANLAKAQMSINAAKGFEYGSGFDGVTMRGSQHNDIFYTTPQKNVATHTNFSGGIQGGISNGMDIYFRVAFKPVATIIQPQQTIDNELNETTIMGKGRHDPCVLPRAVPIVQAMTALVLADHVLWQKATNRL